MIMQISAENKLMVHHLDVKTAYLNAPIDCEVYIRQPEGYTEKREGENLVWKLNKSLYGLKQSGRNWNFVLSEFFQKHKYKKSNIDPCLFHKQDRKWIGRFTVDTLLVVFFSLESSGVCFPSATDQCQCIA